MVRSYQPCDPAKFGIPGKAVQVVPRQRLFNPRDGRNGGECFHGVSGFGDGFPCPIRIEPQGHVGAYGVGYGLDGCKIVSQLPSDLEFDGVITLFLPFIASAAISSGDF